MNTRQIILTTVAMLLMVAVGIWWYFGFSLDFMRFFAAEPVDTTQPGGTQQAQLPQNCNLLQNGTVACPRVSCIAGTQSIAVGATAYMFAYGSFGNYTFFAPGGVLSQSNQPVGSSFTGQTGVRYDTPGIKQVLAIAMRGDDDAVIDVAACQITVVQSIVDPMR